MVANLESWAARPVGYRRAARQTGQGARDCGVPAGSGCSAAGTRVMRPSHLHAPDARRCTRAVPAPPEPAAAACWVAVTVAWPRPRGCDCSVQMTAAQASVDELAVCAASLQGRARSVQAATAPRFPQRRSPHALQARSGARHRPSPARAGGAYHRAGQWLSLIHI